MLNDTELKVIWKRKERWCVPSRPACRLYCTSLIEGETQPVFRVSFVLWFLLVFTALAQERLPLKIQNIKGVKCSSSNCHHTVTVIQHIFKFCLLFKLNLHESCSPHDSGPVTGPSIYKQPHSSVVKSTQRSQVKEPVSLSVPGVKRPKYGFQSRWFSRGVSGAGGASPGQRWSLVIQQRL